ncbi:MAG: arylsulfatase [Verrucomicrobiota bacterium]
MNCKYLIGLTLAVTNTLWAAPSKPNVVILYGDDVGFADIGVNGSKLIPTPYIDQLAAEGINFTDGHCPGATCSASRYAMLTGRLAVRKNVRIISPTGGMPITLEDYTLPKLFRDAGYATSVIGKWHLGLGFPGESVDWNGEVKPGPLEIGFDYSFLVPSTNDRVPCVYLENHRVVNLDPADPISLGQPISPDQTVYPDGRKNPEAMTYYPSSHGHNATVINGIGRIGVMYGGKSALWDDETMGDVFLEKTEDWLDAHLAKNADQPFFLYLPSQMIHVPRAPHPRFQGATKLGYRGDAMVEYDHSVGAVRKMLEARGLTKDTIVIFSSDNGPVYDDGYQDGTVVKTSTEEVDQGHDASGPFRGGKYQIYEGGNRVPFIVSWPGTIKPGTSKALVSHTDFIRSFAELLGLELPEGAAPDSLNSMDALLGQGEGNRYLIQEHSHQLALRDGDWKLIRLSNKGRKNKGKIEVSYALYNLAEDIGEQNDILKQHPERADEMKVLLDSIYEGREVSKVFADQ